MYVFILILILMFMLLVIWHTVIFLHVDLSMMLDVMLVLYTIPGLP